MAAVVLPQIYQETRAGQAVPGVWHAHVAPGGPQDPRGNHRRWRLRLVPPEQEICGICHFFQRWPGDKDEEVLLLHAASSWGMWTQRIHLCVQTCNACACPKGLTRIRGVFPWCQWALEHPTVGYENFISMMSKPFGIRASFAVVYCFVRLWDFFAKVALFYTRKPINLLLDNQKPSCSLLANCSCTKLLKDIRDGELSS